MDRPYRHMIFAATVAILQTGEPTWTLAVGGDIMLNGIRPQTPVFDGIAKAIREADVAYANLEIPLTDARTSSGRKSAAELKAKTQFILKADPRHIEGLAKAGFDLLSLGNNHAMDYGTAGLRQMTKLLDAKGIAHAGAGSDMAEAEKVAVYTLPSGYRVGMISALAFAGSSALNKCGPAGKSTPGVAVFRFEATLSKNARAEIKRRISDAKKECDFLIVAPHWGIEKQSKPREWQLQLGRALVEAGADLVAGAHPHVLQGREFYLGKPILYSLGNLVSPIGGSSAFCFLEFEGRKLKKWSWRPHRYSGGKAVWLSPQEAPAAVRRITALDALIPKPKARAKG